MEAALGMRAKGWLGGGGGDRNNDDPECAVAQAKNMKGRRGGGETGIDDDTEGRGRACKDQG